MNRYRLDIDENERFALICLVAKPIRKGQLGMIGEDGNPSVDAVMLLNRLLSLSPESMGVEQPPRPSAATAAEGKAVAGGNHSSPNPSAAAPLAELPPGITELTIMISKAQESQDGKALVVTHMIRTANSSKSRTIRCWDPKLFDEIRGRVGKITRFRVKESKGFFNIIGVEK